MKSWDERLIIMHGSTYTPWFEGKGGIPLWMSLSSFFISWWRQIHCFISQNPLSLFAQNFLYRCRILRSIRWYQSSLPKSFPSLRFTPPTGMVHFVLLIQFHCSEMYWEPQFHRDVRQCKYLHYLFFKFVIFGNFSIPFKHFPKMHFLGFT